MNEKKLTGRELDERVAEQVLGWVWMAHRSWEDAWVAEKTLLPPEVAERLKGHSRWCEADADDRKRAFHGPKFSEDIEQAWRVVEKMRERGFGCVIGLNGMTDQQNGVIFFQGYIMAGHSLFDASHLCEADNHSVHSTVPLAICHAALRALSLDGAVTSLNERGATNE